MLAPLAFTAVVALQAGLAAAGNAVISNKCGYDIWAWSIAEGASSGAIHIPAGSDYTEAIRNSATGGTSVKISKTSQLTGGAQTQFEYSTVGGQMWYDISFVDCASGDSADNCPGHDGGLTMDSPDGSCSPAVCAAGSYCPEQAYYVDVPTAKMGMRDPVFGCPGTDMDLNMVVCSGGSAKRSIAGRIAIDA
jgi:hypothetical protein